MDERSYAFVPPPPPAASLAAAGAVEHVPPSIDTAHLAAAALRQAQIDLASAGALLEREGTGLGAEELVAIVDDVQHGVAGLLATKKHGLRLQLCQEVQRAAQALRAELEARVAEMGLKRAMSDPRMRGNLEILAYTTKARADAAVLAVGAASVHTSLRAAAPAASAVASRSLSPSLATGTAIKGARAISDADGRLFWETHFGAQVASAPASAMLRRPSPGRLGPLGIERDLAPLPLVHKRLLGRAADSFVAAHAADLPRCARPARHAAPASPPCQTTRGAGTCRLSSWTTCWLGLGRGCAQRCPMRRS